MQTDRILTIVMVLACLITFAAPLYAGWVGIENRSSTNTYHVSAEAVTAGPQVVRIITIGTAIRASSQEKILSQHFLRL